MLPELREIKVRRKKLGITQKKLAEMVGVSQSAIAKIESGKMIPNYNLAKRIFEELEKLECGREKTAREVMSSPVIFVSPGDSVERAAELMLRHSISQLPVVEKEKVVGRISEKIILERGKKGKCREIMGLPFPSVTEETPVRVVREILKREAMVVVYGKGGRLSGVITRSDILGKV